MVDVLGSQRKTHPQVGMTQQAKWRQVPKNFIRLSTAELVAEEIW